MSPITNISPSEVALRAVHAWQDRHRLPSTQDCAMVWVEKYTERDGTTVKGFEPGFMLGPIIRDGRDPRWTLVRLPDSTAFYVLPDLLQWRPTGKYVLEKTPGFAMYFFRQAIGE